jgi:thymidylate kinase
MARYVHFEGMDLAGKSTATRLFAEASGTEWAVRRNSLDPDNPLFLLADSLRKDDAYSAETLGNLYVAALMADIERYQEPESNTIQDSTILLRSLAYHTINKTPRVAEALSGLITAHPQFDQSFVFTASIASRQGRLEERMRTNPEEVAPDDLMVLRKPEKFMAMESCLVDLAQTAFHATVVDTTELNPAEVCGRIMDEVYGTSGPASNV